MDFSTSLTVTSLCMCLSVVVRRQNVNVVTCITDELDLKTGETFFTVRLHYNQSIRLVRGLELSK